MTLELRKEARDAAQASIERYFEQEFDQRLGNLQSAALLDFFVREIGPFVYNHAVSEVQDRLLARVQELDIECHAEELTYWHAKPRRSRGG